MNQPPLVNCRACNGPVSSQAAACPRCGQPTGAAQQATSQARWFLLLLVGGLGLFWWRTCSSYGESARAYDAEFCQKNLAYYEEFCRSNPASCREGPRKLAKCE